MTSIQLHNLLSREHDLLELLAKKQHDILQWLNTNEISSELPLYSSVDIRDSGFKMAVVDTNLFPAGFNNLCEHGLRDAPLLLKFAVQNRVPDAKHVLIITEEHTRNTWYLENVRILQQIVADAGFTATVATFLAVQPKFCDKMNFIECQTATDKALRMHCLQNILKDFESGKRQIDLVILNNDLSSGIPEILKNSPIPIYPAIQAGWHSRLKSHHFELANDLMIELGNILGIDPWLFSTYYAVAPNINIRDEHDRRMLQDNVADIMTKVQAKYDEHGIDEKPYVVIKSDYGTYGMGVLAIEDPAEIALINRRRQNKLSSGKGSRLNDRYVIQEGIPTIYSIDGDVSEACMYQIENHLIGGFFRSNKAKGTRDNLNSKGMNFKQMCPHKDEHKECLFLGGGVERPLAVFDIYRLLARIAAVAAHREITHLKENAS